MFDVSVTWITNSGFPKKGVRQESNCQIRHFLLAMGFIKLKQKEKGSTTVKISCHALNRLNFLGSHQLIPSSCFFCSSFQQRLMFCVLLPPPTDCTSPFRWEGSLTGRGCCWRIRPARPLWRDAFLSTRSWLWRWLRCSLRWAGPHTFTDAEFFRCPTV